MIAEEDNIYREFSDPAGYIKEMFNHDPEAAEESDTTHHRFSRFLLKCLAEFYGGLKKSDNSLKILDYGCGPSIPFSISATSKASEIVLADYNKANREYLQEWVNGGVSAHNWTPYFKYVVQGLERRSEREAEQREDDLRRKVKAVIACDLCKDEFIDGHFREKYDVVMSFLCIQNVARDIQGYRSCIAKLFSLIKEGGHLLLYSTRDNSGEGFYILNGTKFRFFPLKRDFMIETLEETGFNIDTEEYLPLPSHPESNSEGLIFVSARKVHS